MRMRSVFLVAAILCTWPVLGRAEMHLFQLGDDDGFGTGESLCQGDDLYIDVSWDEYALVADGDGTDELIPGSEDLRDFVFVYDAFTSIVSASLFVQYIDWPESGSGVLWIDDHKTSFEFPMLDPWDQASPWTVLAATVDLTPYLAYLSDSRAVFNLLGRNSDAYIVDYMTLSIETSVVPLPASVLIGVFGLGYSGWRLRRTTV